MIFRLSLAQVSFLFIRKEYRKNDQIHFIEFKVSLYNLINQFSTRLIYHLSFLFLVIFALQYIASRFDLSSIYNYYSNFITFHGDISFLNIQFKVFC